MDLRPYQVECLDSIRADFQDYKSTLAVLPTGCGKTVVFSGLARDWYSGRILVLAHREELIHQAARTMRRMLGDSEVAIEMAEHRAVGHGGMIDARVVVASVQSLHPERLKRFRPEGFGLVVIDEAHHAVAENKTYESILAHFRQNPAIKILGVTATPDRADEQALGQTFESCAYNLQIGNAIEDGWLVRVEQRMVFVEDLDLSKVATQMGDLSAGQLDEILAEEKMLHKVVAPAVQIVGDKKTLVFAAGVRQAQGMADVFNRYKPGSAVCLHGGSEKEVRREELKRFADGEFQFLCGCGLFLEGYDEPTIECIVQARPTKSRSLYAQIIGRGTRVLPDTIEGFKEGQFWRLDSPDDRREAISASAKPSLLVVDFVGNAGKHRLMFTGDVLGGNYPDDVVEMAQDVMLKAGKSGQTVAVDDAFKLALQKKKDQERARRNQIILNAKFTTRPVDPFDVYDLTVTDQPGFLDSRRPSSQMVETLRKFGLPIQYDRHKWWVGQPDKKGSWKELTYSRAKQTMATLFARRAKGLATYKQCCLLRKYGESVNVTMETASKIIDEIAASGWRPRDQTVERLMKESEACPTKKSQNARSAGARSKK